MSDSKNFRRINKTEKKIIFDSLRNISPKIILILNDLENSLFISFFPLKSMFPRIFFNSVDLIKITPKINPKITISSSGLYFGFIKKNKFFISLEGTECIYKRNVFNEDHFLIVNEQGEKSILYGNAIVKKMIKSVPLKLKKNDFLLVFNHSRELLAIAFSQVNNIQPLKSNDVIALNLIDKGYYLRREQ